MEIKRGDIFWVDLDPTMGAEIRKTRPCVIVSNDIANRFSPLVTVVPITTQNLDKLYPHEVSLSSVEKLKNSKVKVHQLRTIDKKRMRKKILTLSPAIMEKINWALANHLDLVN